MDIKTTRNNDIQYHIESNAVLGLRATFMQEPVFTYNEEEKLFADSGAADFCFSCGRL